MSILLTHHGEPLAAVGTRCYHLAPHLADRTDDDPERRTVVALCQMLTGRNAALKALRPSLRPSPN